MKRSLLLACVICCLPLVSRAADAPATVEPFAFSPKTAAKPVHPPAANQVKLDCFGNGGKNWFVGGIPFGPGATPFTVQQQEIKILPRQLAVGQTFVAFPLDEKQIKPTYNYIAFTAASTQTPLQITVYVSTSAAGATVAKTAVTIAPGAPQRVVLPVSQFNLRGAVKLIGFGIETANADSDLVVSDLAVGTAPLTADVLKAQRTMISLVGLWKFATDDGDRGTTEKWFAPGFDDSKWRSIKSSQSWQEQGVAHAGWGWYRQKIMIPKEAANVPLTIALADFQYEDDCYFNGVRIGGLTGNYKYNNMMQRQYSVPPSAVKYGELNTIAVRVWGIDGGTFGVSKCGLTAGMDPKGTYYVADLDPYAVRLRKAGAKEEFAPDQFDLSDAQHGMAFDVVFRFPADAIKKGPGLLRYTLVDYYGHPMMAGQAQVTSVTGAAQAVVPIDVEQSKQFYLRGRFKAHLVLCDSGDVPVCTDVREIDRLSFGKRDALSLPALAEQVEDTPYGKLRLIDEIDCAADASQDPHPYMQLGFGYGQDRSTPGAPVDIQTSNILGKNARECGFGAFAYRIGRGKLTPHKTYLLRVEYPEDKPRYAPMEIQCGHSFMDIGWKNGVSKDDPYDNWPLSNKWAWYDAVFPLDEETTGTSGTGGASAEHGVWVYFMNKRRPGRYFQMFEGGPAIGRLKLYELDADTGAPKITFPGNLPRRTLMLDWERQADQPPEDLVKYAKLMGYNGISPIMLKWAFANYGDPIPGYETTTIDGHRYWVKQSSDDEDEPAPSDTPDAEAPAPGADNIVAKPAAAPASAAGQSVHRQYLAATKKYDIQYIPRIEYGGSNALPLEARAIGGDGELAKPNRFARWGADLLHPATWADLQRTIDGYFKPFVADNPQLTGMLWRIRSDRMQISYSRGDVEMFCKETGVALPSGTNRELAAWASDGDIAPKYVDWWHQKRAQLHLKLAALLKSYRPDLTAYYFNWDSDKWALGVRDMNTASTFTELATSRFGLVSEVYDRHVRLQKSLTGDDYVRMIRTGQQTDWPVWGREYGLRTELYRDQKGFQLFAPANTLYLADNPTYLNYFQTGDGLAVSNVVSYDELGARTINPKFEGNMVTPAGAPFSMAMELLSYFHGDARTLTYTVYTYGRGFADAHRRFAQAFLALPAIKGTVVDQANADVKVRTYPSDAGTYVGVAYKGYVPAHLTVKLPALKAGASVINLVTGQTAALTADGIDLQAGPMELNAFLVK